MKRTLARLTGAAIAIPWFATASDANAHGRPGVASVARGASGARRLMATQTRATEEIRGNRTGWPWNLFEGAAVPQSIMRI